MAFDPHDTPVTFVTRPGAGQPSWEDGPDGLEWHPNDSPIDGHDEPFENIGDGLAPPAGGVPQNIHIVPGPFSRTKQ